MRQEFGLSVRRACALVGVWRSTMRYQSKRQEPAEHIAMMKALAAKLPRYGYRRLHGERGARLHPATEEVIARAPSGDDRTIEQAIAAARVAFDTGPRPRIPPTERTTVLIRFHDELVVRATEIASLVVSEHLR